MANKYLFQGSLLYPNSVPKAALSQEVLDLIGQGLTAAQVDAKIDNLKVLLMGGQVNEAFDTFKELAEAVTADKTGLAALTQALAGKATPADIQAAVEKLVGTASQNANTLGKLETLVQAAIVASQNALGDGTVTNAKLGVDVKIGSINGAANAFPTEVQAALVSAEKIFVYIGQQLASLRNTTTSQTGGQSDLNSRLNAVEQTLSNKASANELNSLATRVGTTEGALAGKASSSDLTTATGRVTRNEQDIAQLKLDVASLKSNGTGTGAGGSTNGVTLRNTGDGTKFLADDGSYRVLNSSGPSIGAASSTTAGIAKLYNEAGQNEDGGITQKAATNLYATKTELANSNPEIVRIDASLPPNGTLSLTRPINRQALVGTYDLEETSGVSNVRYKRDTVDVFPPFALSAGQSLEITGTTGTTWGYVVLRKR